MNMTTNHRTRYTLMMMTMTGILMKHAMDWCDIWWDMAQARLHINVWRCRGDWYFDRLHHWLWSCQNTAMPVQSASQRTWQTINDKPGMLDMPPSASSTMMVLPKPWREAAKASWGRSVAQHGLRYRTMLSDGDSVVFAAVTELQPYGATRPVKKVECINHVHKHMGTALRKQAQECQLGGGGGGGAWSREVTADKCRKLQNYFCGATLGNKGKPKKMEDAIWASLFHCTSTDADPHHGHCPDGENSWCFYKKAQALGEQPGPHADNLTTDLSREVAQQLLPLYWWMSCNTILSKVLHGNSKQRVLEQQTDSAVATAVCKFNWGNLFLAELMDNHATAAFTINILEAKDIARLKQADKAAEAQFAMCRRNRHVQQATVCARQDHQEGEVYGAGMMADH